MTMYAYYNPSVPSPSPVIGFIDTVVTPNFPLPAQDSIFELTPEQFGVRLNGHYAIDNGAFVAYKPPVSIATQALVATSQGVKVTFAGVLDGVTFPIDQATQTRMQSILLLLQRRGTFPGKLTTYPLMDITNTPWQLTVSQYEEVATQILEYASSVDLIFNGNPLKATELPEPSITITT
jgi:hypothetical protein